LVLSAQAVTGHARLNNITIPPYSMELTSFFNLLRSGDDDNLELAWQIALGFKEAGEQFFIDFIESVEFLSRFFEAEDEWFFDEENEPNFNFPKVLIDICEGRIKLKNFNKNELPEYLKVLSPQINRLYFEQLQSAVFPTGLEHLQNITFLNIHLADNIFVGEELWKMPNLYKIYISAEKNITISPGIVKCSKIEEINLYCPYGNKIYFPSNFHELKILKTLNIRAPFEGVFLKDLSVEELTLNLTDKKENIDGLETLTRLIETDNFSANLKKLHLNYSSNSKQFEKFINEKVVQAINLKELIIFNSTESEWKLDNSFLGLIKLEKLNIFYYHFLSNTEIIAQLPQLKEFTVSHHCSEAQAITIKEILQKNASKAELIVEELPF
jgi:hypothetical protein